jgi:hypothetical protein
LLGVLRIFLVRSPFRQVSEGIGELADGSLASPSGGKLVMESNRGHLLLPLVVDGHLYQIKNDFPRMGTGTSRRR